MAALATSPLTATVPVLAAQALGTPRCSTGTREPRPTSLGTTPITIPLSSRGTAGTVTIGTPVTVGGLTINATGYVVSGAPGINFGTAGNINVSSSFQISISAPISGSAITKTGTGTVVLSGNSSFSGLTISDGVVRAEGGGNSFGASGSTITIDGGQIHGRNTQTHEQSIILNQAMTSFVKGNNGNWQFTGAVSGTGGLVVNDSSGITARILTFSSTSNSFTGAIDLRPNFANFQFNSLADSASFGAGNIIFDTSMARFGLGNGTAVPVTLNNRRIEITANGSGTSQISNANTTASNTLTINSDLNVTATTGVKTLQLMGVNTGNNAFNGAITNGSLTGVGNQVAVTKAETGTWILGGNNSYTGATNVSAGILRLGANDVLPDSSAVSIGAATLDANSRTDTAGTLDVTATATIHLASGAALAFADSSAVNWSGGSLNITGTLGATSLRFSTNSSGLLPAQLALISVNGSAPGTYILNANGYLVLNSGATPYDTWAGEKGLTVANQANNLDPDGDGNNNLAEFAFNGNPLSGSDNGKIFVLTAYSDVDGDTTNELILTVAVRSGTPAFAGSPTLSAVHPTDGITYSIEGSLD